MSNPLAGAGASPDGAKKAQAAIDKARRIAAEDRARAGLHRGGRRLLRRLRQPPGAGAATRAGRKRSRRSPRSYPDDDEAQIFSALYIAGTQSQADQTYAAYMKAAAILEKLFMKYPDHPGVAHYLIHSYDAPPIAEKGLTAARRYATIAPDSPHALHMPSHIFTRVGAWQDSVVTNRRSPTWPSRTATGTRPTTRATTWCTRTCSSVATRPRGSRGRGAALQVATPRHRHSPTPRSRCPRGWPSSAATGPRQHSSSPEQASCRSAKPSRLLSRDRRGAMRRRRRRRTGCRAARGQHKRS